MRKSTTPREHLVNPFCRKTCTNVSIAMTHSRTAGQVALARAFAGSACGMAWADTAALSAFSIRQKSRGVWENGPMRKVSVTSFPLRSTEYCTPSHRRLRRAPVRMQSAPNMAEAPPIKENRDATQCIGIHWGVLQPSDKRGEESVALWLEAVRQRPLDPRRFVTARPGNVVESALSGSDGEAGQGRLPAWSFCAIEWMEMSPRRPLLQR